MSEDKKPAEQTPAKVAPENGKDQPSLPLVNRPQFVMEEATGMFWVGLPLSVLPALNAVVILDRAKSEALDWYIRATKRPQIIKPGFMDRSKAMARKILLQGSA